MTPIVPITNKYRIARLLTLGESPLAVPLITNALTGEFANRYLPRSDASRLRLMIKLLGVEGREDDVALGSLPRGCSLEFWESAAPPQESFRAWRWAGACLTALALTERPEARAMLEEPRDDPERVARMEVDGALVDAAFSLDYLEEHGPPATFNGDLHDAFWVWKHTTANGMGWAPWSSNVFRIRRELRRQQSR